MVALHMEIIFIALYLIRVPVYSMPIFTVELGFTHSAENLLMAKTGILFSSTLAYVSGFI